MCPDTAHIHVDECGAPERFTGCKLLALPTPDGKLRPEQIEPLLHVVGDEHHAQPRVVSITQSTEQGTLYRPDEIAALADVAHRHDLFLHLDGARLANAAAALGADVRAFTTRGRSRRAHLRRDQGGRHVRRSGGVPPPRSGRAGAVRAQTGCPAAVEDALRRRPVRGPAHRRPVAAGRRATPTPWPRCSPSTSRTGPASRWSGPRRSTRCSCDCRRPPRCAELQAWSFVWDWDALGARGAGHDLVRHDRGRRRAFRRPGWPSSPPATPDPAAPRGGGSRWRRGVRRGSAAPGRPRGRRPRAGPRSGSAGPRGRSRRPAAHRWADPRRSSATEGRPQAAR